jgi:hypothetical protein
VGGDDVTLEEVVGGGEGELGAGLDDATGVDGADAGEGFEVGGGGGVEVEQGRAVAECGDVDVVFVADAEGEVDGGGIGLGGESAGAFDEVEDAVAWLGGEDAGPGDGAGDGDADLVDAGGWVEALDLDASIGVVAEGEQEQGDEDRGEEGEVRRTDATGSAGEAIEHGYPHTGY